MTNSKLYWPLKSSGSLDGDIFDDDFIKDVFYKSIPQKYKCSHVTVRKGLKGIYKKSIPAKRTTDKREIESAVCSSSKGRASLPNMKIFIDRKDNFSRGPKKIKKLNINFSQLLWLYYTEGDFKELVEWTTTVAEGGDKIGQKYYITQKSLKEKLKHNACPIDFNSKHIARVLTIFAGLLDEPDERNGLLKTAQKLGNEFIKFPEEIILKGQDYLREKNKLEPYQSLISFPDIA